MNAMNMILLSGNSLRNRDWIYEASAQLRLDPNATYIQDYRHWETGEEWIDLPHELETLSQAAARLETPYAVLAKSIGTVLTTQAIERGVIRPRFLLLCGLPLGYIESDYPQFAQVINDSGLPTTVVHNQHDPVGESQAVKTYMSKYCRRPNYHFIETPGDTHEYLDYELLQNELAKLQGDK